ncbi:MAG TPA: hypothetical protein VGC86_16955 [Afipia sp.]
MSRHFGNPSHAKTEVLSPKARPLDLLAIYGAFGLIAAIVFGTVFGRLF